MKIIPSNQRFSADHGWLKTNWLFSFGDYYDPQNESFGSLRVYNDDVVLPNTGFDTHGHRDMEIVTLVLDGAVTHGDSLGNKASIPAGEIQAMTAGSGIRHSEHNRESKNLHLHQVWFLPRQKGLTPAYQQVKLPPASETNRLSPLVSGLVQAPLKINSDATMYLGRLSPDGKIQLVELPDVGVFIYVIDGKINVNGTTIGPGDQVRAEHEGVAIVGVEESRFTLIEVALHGQAAA